MSRASTLGVRALRLSAPALSLGARALEWRWRCEFEDRRPEDLRHPPGVEADRLAIKLAFLQLIERALTERRLSDASLQALVQVLAGSILTQRGDAAAKERFRREHGCGPPDFLVIAPGKACNLRCEGCYANSGAQREKLEFETLTRIIEDAKRLWGSRFFVISGGEPFAWRDGGLGIVELAQMHPDCFFIVYSNGTLIDEALARRLGRLGNLSPGLSLEGLQERTDRRRGAGVYSKVVAAMRRLREAGVLFGLSLTVGRDNAEEILSDPMIDEFMERRGAAYAWIFHYMPIGRAPELDAMATPAQRVALWRRMWDLIHDRRLFIVDFWNSATLTNGCVAGGRSGGYLYVDWNGDVRPCVFVPYSPLNVREVFAAGGDLNDVWANPFFGSIRGWQRRHGYRENGEPCGETSNWLTPCLIRDHHVDFVALARRHEPRPASEDERAALDDGEYRERLCAYDRELQSLTEPIWRAQYLQPGRRRV